MLLARLNYSKRNIRADKTVRPEALIPYPHRGLSVTNATNQTQAEVWAAGLRIQDARNAANPSAPNITLDGRIDLDSSAYLQQGLQIEAEPIPEDCHHMNINGWQETKPAQKEIAQKLAAQAQYIAYGGV